VGSDTTTRCCSALALVALCLGCLGAAGGQRPAGPKASAPKRTGKDLPISPFPPRTHYTLPLHNQLIAPPGYGGTIGYFPIEDDRIVSYALDVGSQRWIVPASPLWAPAVSDDFLIISEKDGLSALRTSDGSAAWTAPVPGALTVAPLCDHGWIIVATASDVFAFRASDGSPVWQRPIAGVRVTPAIDADRLYLSLGDGRVRALQLDTGEQIWERKIGGDPNAIAVRGERLFVGSTNNFLYALKTSGGAIDWSVLTGADVVTKPILNGDRVYFLSLDNVLRAMNQRNGVQQWKKALPFRPEFPPLQAADAIVVASRGGLVRAYFMKDGQSAGEMTADNNAEIVAPFYAFSSVTALGPVVVMVTNLIAEGSSVVAVSHTIDPRSSLLTEPLPGVMPPVVPKTAASGR
jgi:outer membrane protein assembly factor BamB